MNNEKNDGNEQYRRKKNDEHIWKHDLQPRQTATGAEAVDCEIATADSHAYVHSFAKRIACHIDRELEKQKAKKIVYLLTLLVLNTIFRRGKTRNCWMHYNAIELCTACVLFDSSLFAAQKFCIFAHTVAHPNEKFIFMYSLCGGKCGEFDFVLFRVYVLNELDTANARRHANSEFDEHKYQRGSSVIKNYTLMVISLPLKWLIEFAEN